MAIIKDRMIYVVVSARSDGAILPERNVCDLDRATTIKDIADGQFGEVDQVLELNPVEGTCRDVTGDILGEISNRRAWDAIDAALATQSIRFDHNQDHRKQVVA